MCNFYLHRTLNSASLTSPRGKFLGAALLFFFSPSFEKKRYRRNFPKNGCAILKRKKKRLLVRMLWLLYSPVENRVYRLILPEHALSNPFAVHIWSGPPWPGQLITADKRTLLISQSHHWWKHCYSFSEDHRSCESHPQWLERAIFRIVPHKVWRIDHDFQI